MFILMYFSVCQSCKFYILVSKGIWEDLSATIQQNKLKDVDSEVRVKINAAVSLDDSVTSEQTLP